MKSGVGHQPGLRFPQGLLPSFLSQISQSVQGFSRTISLPPPPPFFIIKVRSLFFSFFLDS